MKNDIASRFCRCIKHVRKTIKPRKQKNTKESSAIAVCVKSVIQKKDKRRTIKRFKCKLPRYLLTQPT